MGERGVCEHRVRVWGSGGVAGGRAHDVCRCERRSKHAQHAQQRSQHVVQVGGDVGDRQGRVAGHHHVGRHAVVLHKGLQRCKKRCVGQLSEMRHGSRSEQRARGHRIPSTKPPSRLLAPAGRKLDRVRQVELGADDACGRRARGVEGVKSAAFLAQVVWGFASVSSKPSRAGAPM